MPAPRVAPKSETVYGSGKNRAVVEVSVYRSSIIAKAKSGERADSQNGHVPTAPHSDKTTTTVGGSKGRGKGTTNN